jgi:hypothetical protein
VRFSYEICPRGGGPPIDCHSFDAPDLQIARELAQTVPAPAYEGSDELDVRLMDANGQEVWRGPWLGPFDDA